MCVNYAPLECAEWYQGDTFQREEKKVYFWSQSYFRKDLLPLFAKLFFSKVRVGSSRLYLDSFLRREILVRTQKRPPLHSPPFCTGV